jgi:phosphotransferase system enzyme I (PtsI)
MQELQGIAVSPGVAIGEALVIDNEGFRIPQRFVSRDAVEDELARLARSVEAVAGEIARHRDVVAEQLGSQYGAIFSAHLAMVRDPQLRDEIEQLIREHHFSPEYAVSRALRRYAKVFQSVDLDHLAERAHDIFDIEKRLLRNLLGRRREELSHITSPVIVLAHNLTPSETANLDRDLVLGFVTEIGGAGGHTAIVAEALEIPAVVGTGPFLVDVFGGELVIIDGDQGKVILQPDDETIARYHREEEQHRTLAAKLGELRDLPAQTSDGERICLYANIEFPEEVEACLQRGADGIGLYRTEFLYLGAETEPTESDHYDAYAKVLRAMGDRPVVIRTLDLGADKINRGSGFSEERNPFLGLRSIRLSLRNLPLFRTQLRAVLRASTLGNLRVLFPLVSTVPELRQAKSVLAEIMEDLQREEIPFNRDMLIGMMVEVPAAAVTLDRFVSEVDFISIGTNDLIQYALAVDRTNTEVADLYSASDPSVLRLIQMAIDSAQRGSLRASLCGQMSGMSMYTMLLLGLGLREMSVAPSAVPEIKRVCRSVTIPQCERVASKAMSMDSAEQVSFMLREELKMVAPELAVH